jgi:hypothetical protein
VILSVFTVLVSECLQGEKTIFTHFQRRNAWTRAMKKQQLRVKKASFRLEKRNFSSSIANASEEAVLCW